MIELTNKQQALSDLRYIVAQSPKLYGADAVERLDKNPGDNFWADPTPDFLAAACNEYLRLYTETRKLYARGDVDGTETGCAEIGALAVDFETILRAMFER